MNSERYQPTNLLPQSTADISQPSEVTRYETNPHDQRDDGHILVHFNGQFNGQFNGTFMMPAGSQGSGRGESDAQIAARRAMAKRNSRSFAARISRSRSRKLELVGRPTKPGITVDTSFARHKGAAPHQVFPQESTSRRSVSMKKQGWLGIGRTSTKNKGLGIMKGTPQPGQHTPDNRYVKDPASAEPVTSGNKTWQEISPWDRPIPIGISIPSGSMPDYNPYQENRQRSGSDTTLVTPSIIVTPAGAMKSVWSPDTASDYTPGRASSIYSRATYNLQSADSNVPPVPALPANMKNASNTQSSSGIHLNRRSASAPHVRSDTLDSAGTAFEEDGIMTQEGRVMSTSTFFEEDETPLRERNIQSPMSIDTSLVPTPRRSQGWWNVITTPFQMSRTNSVWTQNQPNAERTPEVPAMPAHFGIARDSTNTQSTYIWSATDESPESRSDSHFVTSSVPTVVPSPTQGDRTLFKKTDDLGGHSLGIRLPLTGSDRGTEDISTKSSSHPDKRNVENGLNEQASPPFVPNMASPSSAMSASPVVGNATIGTVLMPRQITEQTRPIDTNNGSSNDRTGVISQTTNAESPPISRSNRQETAQRSNTASPVPQMYTVDLSSSKANDSQQTLPVFAPPPIVAKKESHFSHEYGSRPSSSSSASPDTKGQKKHRKVADVMSWFPCGRRPGKSKEGNNKKKNRGWCFWCCGCCIILLVLLVIIIPVTVVFTKKNNAPKGEEPGQEPRTQWLNLTGYPPVPAGISTIAQPEVVMEESGCVAPTTLWSCALPKELHESVEPNDPDQPNFKLEITFSNESRGNTENQLSRKATNPVTAGALIRSRFLSLRAAPVPSPAVPDEEEMKFLGETTDENEAPFEGEETPFSISFQEPQQKEKRLVRRADKSADSDNAINITSGVPPPEVNADGTAAPANLLPYPSAQPLRLFNRDTDDEYYGFYTYFDRSIFLKDVTEDINDRGGNPADRDGGSDFTAATMRCTFSQTRFLVQIWTRSSSSKNLLQGSAQTSSETLFERPGSFPYPITITLDRHGGDFAKKNVFCYQMEKDGTMKETDASNPKVEGEDRAFGGNLVNGTKGRQNVKGPIDGGSGGCRCQWQNFFD